MAINEETGFTDRKKAKEMQALYAKLRGETRRPPQTPPGLGADADGDVYDFYVLGANHGVCLAWACDPPFLPHPPPPPAHTHTSWACASWCPCWPQC